LFLEKKWLGNAVMDLFCLFFGEESCFMFVPYFEQMFAGWVWDGFYPVIASGKSSSMLSMNGIIATTNIPLLM
jgi:hypothetical protein